MRRWSNAGSLLGRGRKQWISSKWTFGQRLVTEGDFPRFITGAEIVSRLTSVMTSGDTYWMPVPCNIGLHVYYVSWYPSKHCTLTQCLFDDGPALETSHQYWFNLCLFNVDAFRFQFIWRRCDNSMKIKLHCNDGHVLFCFISSSLHDYMHHIDRFMFKATWTVSLFGKHISMIMIAA